MKKKLLLQDLAAQLATGSGLTRKESESFARAFFEVIESGLLEDKFVKIKGFGTFKLIVVSERESVNVNTGERFQIGRHSKVSFTPEASLKELVNRPFAHFEAVDLNDATDVAELNSVDGGLAEEAAEAEDALAATEWAEERAESTAETEEENALTVSGVQNDIEAEKENGKEPAETDSDKKETNADKGETDTDKRKADSDKRETGVDEKETNTAEKETESDEGETDEANDIRVSPPTPISRGEQASEEGTPSPLPAAPAPVPQEPTPADAPAATVSVAENVTESAADRLDQTAPNTQQAAKEPQQASPTPEQTATKPQQTAQEPKQNAAQNGTQSASSDKQCLNAAGEGAVSISYTETPRPAGRNWWKTATLTICVLLLMALSYFAGYFQLLCPCTFLGREVPPPALPSRPQHVPAPETRPAPAQTSAAPADTPQQSETAGGAPAATNGKNAPAPGKDAANTCKDAAASTKNAANNGKNTAEAAEGKCAPAQPAAPAADNALPRTHKVKAGDNLSRLSRRYYGSDKHIDFIIKTNKLRDADNIPLGSTLTFPPLPQNGR